MSKSFFITVKDFSVSGEKFQLKYNKQWERLETFPKPDDNTLALYYKSEDYISHTDSKRSLFEWAYHAVRHITLKHKLKLITTLNNSNSKNILDIGCGTGDFLQIAQQAGWEVSGIEPNESARKIANLKIKQGVKTDQQINAFQDHSFDVITLWHVLEHVPNLDHQLEQIKRLLNPNGVLIVAVPNYKSYDAKHYNQFWAAYDVPRHLWHFSKKGISKLFSTIGFSVIQTKPMVFDAYYVALLSEKYKSGKMNLFTAIYRAWCSNRAAKRTGEFSSLIYILKKN